MVDVCITSVSRLSLFLSWKEALQCLDALQEIPQSPVKKNYLVYSAFETNETVIGHYAFLFSLSFNLLLVHLTVLPENKQKSFSYIGLNYRFDIYSRMAGSSCEDQLSLRHCQLMSFSCLFS